MTMHDLLAASAKLFPLSLAQQAGRLVFTILMARWLGPESYGAFATLFVLIEILILPTGLGFSQSIVRYGARYHREQEQAHLEGILRFSLLSTITVGCLIAAAVTWAILPLLEQSLSQHVVFHLLLAAPFGALVQIQAGYLLATQRPNTSLATKQLIPDWLTLGGVLALFPILHEATVHEAIWLITLSYAATAAIQWLIIQKRKQPTTSPRYQGKKWLNRSLPLMLAASGTALVTRLDILLVSQLEGDLAVAVFFPVFIIAGLGLIPVHAVMTVSKPLIANAHKDEIYRLCVQNTRALFIVNTPSIIFLGLTGAWLLELYGERYPDIALPVLLITLAGRLLVPLRLSANALIKLRGNPWHASFGLVIGTITALLCAFWLHQLYGLNGIAFGFVVGFATGIVIRMAFVRFALNVPLKIICGISE